MRFMMIKDIIYVGNPKKHIMDNYLDFRKLREYREEDHVFLKRLNNIYTEYKEHSWWKVERIGKPVELLHKLLLKRFGNDFNLFSLRPWIVRDNQLICIDLSHIDLFSFKGRREAYLTGYDHDKFVFEVNGKERIKYDGDRKIIVDDDCDFVHMTIEKSIHPGADPWVDRSAGYVIYEYVSDVLRLLNCAKMRYLAE